MAMDSFVQRIRQTNAKALLLSRINLFFIVLNCLLLIVLIVTWAVSIGKETGGVLPRYAPCTIFFIFVAIATFLSVLVHRLQPNMLLYYSHEIISILALIFGAASMGTNSVVVEVCRDGTYKALLQCESHIMELVAEIFLCFSMGFNYASTQQRIVTFIDNGILDGIKGRSPGVTQLQ